jgi:hypothetical protein
VVNRFAMTYPNLFLELFSHGRSPASRWDPLAPPWRRRRTPGREDLGEIAMESPTSPSQFVI